MQQSPERCENNHTYSRTYEVNNKKYLVISRFAGTKDLNQVIRNLALRQAYADAGLSA